MRRAPSIRFSRRCALHRIHGTKPPFRSSRKMKHRDIEYTLVQGVGRHIWKWSVVLDDSRSATGQAMTKAEAVSDAERAIDRALALKRMRLVPPGTEGSDQETS